MYINNIGVHIKVKDFNKSLTFYEALGFKKIFEYGPDKEIKEDYNGVVFEHGGGKIEIADDHRAVRKEVFGEKVTSSKMSLMIGVDNIYSVMRAAEKANIPLAVRPRHYYWGTLEVVIKDPDGVVLVFVSPFKSDIAKKINADESFALKP